MTKKINLKIDPWCVLNTGGRDFQIVIDWLNHNYPNELKGAYPECYHGVLNKELHVLTFSFGTELSISEFIELAKDEVESTELVDERQWLREHKEYNDTGYLEEDTEEHPDKSEPVSEGWVEVINEVPPIGERVLCFTDRNDMIVAYRNMRGVWKTTGLRRNYYLGDIEVSHWQPLPKNPKQFSSTYKNETDG